jgi:hypothetical protein
MLRIFIRKPRKPRPPEGYIATEISNKYGKAWWLVKKALLMLAALASIAGSVLWLIYFDKAGALYAAGGLVIGLLCLWLSLWAVSKFHVRVTRAVFIPLFAGMYLAYTIQFLF